MHASSALPCIHHRMNKLERFQEGEWVGHAHPRAFIRQITTGPDRLRVGVPGGSLEPILLLLSLLEEPLTLLYVLHTPRGESQPGRYQSPEMTRHEVLGLLDRFSAYLTSDARHDLWIRSLTAFLVWDSHDIVYFYGDLITAEAQLQTAGYAEGEVLIPSPHAHNYHAALDADEQSLVAACEWTRSELRPEDGQ
jgi:hypothetical protein